jgi:hypothetical protein
MDIKHCDCLSLFLRRRECHEQDGETLRCVAMPPIESASGDPAMAFDLPLKGRAIIHPSSQIGSGPAAGRTADKRDIRFGTRESIARKRSATNSQPLDQRSVTRIVDPGEIIEELAPLRDQLEQSTSGMIVLDVNFEMLSEAVDALREERYLHLRRSSVAGLGGIAIYDFGLAARRNRHRDFLLLRC